MYNIDMADMGYGVECIILYYCGKRRVQLYYTVGELYCTRRIKYTLKPL